MIKWRTYWRSSPVRDKISVENVILPTDTCRPVGTEYDGYCVPNGTPGFAGALIFYQYRIPNGMRRPVRDKILVENVILPTSTCRPVGTEHNGCCVPNGTPGFACALVFYQHHIPNGMTKPVRHFINNITIVKESKLLLKQKHIIHLKIKLS